MTQIFYTNYKLESRDSLIQKAKSRSAIIADCRHTPYSQFYSLWNKNVLEEYFKENYIHIKEFGNQNFGTHKEFNIVDVKKGIEIVEELLKTKSIILLCACSEFDKCHLKEIVKNLEIHFDEVEISEL